MKENEVIKTHLPCNNCGSSDALSLYSDGHAYCFSCNNVTREEGNNSTLNDCTLLHTTITAIPKRGINETTCKKYQYGTSKYHGEIVHVANYYNEHGHHVGQKLRFKDKQFRTKGKVGDCFFGQHLFSKGKRLIDTEGEIDCLTISQLYANTVAVVSIPTGAAAAKRVFERQLEWLVNFDEVVVVFDNDQAGHKAVQEIQGVLPADKLKVVRLTQYKDPNEYYLNNYGNELIDVIDNAKTYTPDGIVNGSELWDSLINEKEEAEGYSLPYNIQAQNMIKGIRKGEIVLITAGTGTGKSTIVRELMYDLGMRHKCKVGIMMLEENLNRTAKGLIGIHLQKPIHISRKSVSDEEYLKAFKETLGTERFVLYNHFGSLEKDKLLNTMRYMALTEKCDFIILDHVSIATSGIEGNDERKLIDVLMTKLRSLCEETGVGMIAVCHLKRVDDKQAHEEGAIVSLNHLRGSHSLAQLADTIIALERNQQATDDEKKNTIKVRVLKCRLTGKTGLGGALYFNDITNRLEETTMRDNASDDEEGDF